MENIYAQETTNHPGASDASDFQPMTQNPQAAPGQVFPETGGLQNPTTNQLLQTRKDSIQVPNNPAPAEQTSVAQAKDGGGVVIVAVIMAAVVLVAVHLWRLRRNRPITPEPIENISEQPILAPVNTPKPATKPKPTVKKPAPKKSKSQRKKRARR